MDFFELKVKVVSVYFFDVAYAYSVGWISHYKIGC